MEITPVKITAIPNGPLLVEGRVTIKRPDGTEEIKETKCHLCRCGHSANKPFCDATHKKIGFIG